MDMAVCNSALCDVWMKTSENRLLMMQKLVVLSSFSFFSIMNVELLWNYWGISNCIDIKCIEWIDLWSVGLQIWICVYVILQYVIFEWKLCFDHELKIEKMPVSGLFCVFKLRIHGSSGTHNWLATLYTHPRDVNVLYIKWKVIFSPSCSTNIDAIRYSSRKIKIKIPFFHFYFLKQDFLFTIMYSTLKLCNLVDNSHLEGTVSQIFY